MGLQRSTLHAGQSRASHPRRRPPRYALGGAALVDTEEMVPEELAHEYALELQATLTATVEKRDRVGQFLAHLDAQIAFAHAEVARLKARAEFYEKVFARMESYVSRVIESLGLDAKGKRKS